MKTSAHWREYEVTTYVPAEAESLAFGVNLGGFGRLWVDDVSFSLDGQPVTVAPAMPHQGHAVATIGAPQGWGFSLSAGLVSRYGMAAGAAALLSAGSALSQATDVQRLFHEACARPAD